MSEIEQRIESRLSQRFEAQFEQRIESCLSQRFEAQFEQLKAQMFENMDSRGSESGIRVPDATSGRRIGRESVEHDNTPLDQSRRTPPLSSRPNDQVKKEVYLLNSGIPKVDVGEGLLITMDSATELDGKPIGEGFCKVVVTKVIKPNVSLERPRRGLRTVADAFGRYVAWRACNLVEKEMDI